MLSLQYLSRNKPILSVVLSIAIFSFIYFFSFTSLNKTVHNSFLKLSSKEVEIKGKVNKDIVIVGIDEKTLNKLGRFPFSRELYIPVLENLEKKGAAVIGLDLIFADKTDDIIDNKFAKSIKETGNVVLGGAILNETEIEYPLKIFFDAGLAFGYFTQSYEKSLNVIHRFIPFRNVKYKYLDNGIEKYANKTFEHFSISILKAYYYSIFKDEDIITNTKFDENFYYITDNKKIPFSGQGKNILIKFAPTSKFTTISFIDVYDEQQLELAINHIQSNQKNFSLKDKIILIGTTAKGIKDIFYTPNGSDYGVYLHANIINTILTNNYHKYFNEKLELLLLFLLIIVSFYLNLNKGGYIIIFSNIALISIFSVIFPFIMYSLGFILNRPVDLIFVLILSLLLSNIVKYLIENKNKTKLVRALSEYISKDIAQKILSNVGDMSMDGEKKRISIFFSDIAGFTTISEKFSPEDLVLFLRDYLGAMSHIIMDERGFIDKYEGDAIMALWGVFGFENTLTYDNCKSALYQQEKLRELNLKWEKIYGEKLEVRMGLHTGDAIIGNIGAKGRKMEFTALGDSVNLASRLEGVNKFYGTNICVSEDVKLEVEDSFVFRYLDKIRVKGKIRPVKIFELVGFNAKVESYKLDIMKEFEKALELYFDKKFKEAENIFKRLGSSGDRPSEIFAKRCKELSIKYEINIPRENWDGVWEMKEK